MKFEDGKWRVDVSTLPDHLQGQSLAVIDEPRDLLIANAETIASREADRVGIGASERNTYVETVMRDHGFRFKIARQEAEGVYGTELQHARLLVAEMNKKHKRNQKGLR